MKHFLFSAAGKSYLETEYEQKCRSTYEIAKEHSTYPNLVNRALRFHDMKVRDKGEAQKQALASGRHPHPTKGKHRPDDVKAKISQKHREKQGERAS